jgi:hypothetical protein
LKSSVLPERGIEPVVAQQMSPGRLCSVNGLAAPRPASSRLGGEITFSRIEGEVQGLRV